MPLTIPLLATLLFGAVEPWSLALVGCLTAVAFVIFVARFEGLPGYETSSRTILAAAVAVFAYGIFQLVPFPAGIIRFIHPALSGLLVLPPDLPTAAAVSRYPSFHSLSIYPFATEMELARIVVYLMLFATVAFGMEDRKDIHRLIRLLIIFGFILAIFGIIQKAAWNEKIYWFRTVTNPRAEPFGPFVNRNHFAGWINFVIPLALGMGLAARDMNQRVRYLLFSFVMAAALFFSLSRGGIIAFFAGVFVFVVFVLKDKVAPKRLIPVFLFITLLVIFLAYVGLSPLMKRFAQVDIPTEERILVWKATFGAFLDFPAFGSGLGTYPHVFRAYHPPTWFFYDFGHNDYLQFLLEAGIAGLAVAAIFFFSIFRVVYGTEWIERDSMLKAGLSASFTTIAVHSIFDFNLHVPSNALLLAFLLGIAVALGRLNTEHDEEPPSPEDGE
jgi:O-antigen ligase